MLLRISYFLSGISLFFVAYENITAGYVPFFLKPNESSLETLIASEGYQQNKETHHANFIGALSGSTVSKYSWTAFSQRIKTVAQGSSQSERGMIGAWYEFLKSAPRSFQLTEITSHTGQLYRLSCEANSARDLINFYWKNKNLELIPEERVIRMLRYDSTPLVYRVNRDPVWGDPDFGFVGSIDGRQRSDVANMTGYGIHARGLLPTVNQLLRPLGKNASVISFSQERIIDSLRAGNPVILWYIDLTIRDGAGNSRTSLRPVVWKTPGGKTIVGWIGEHTAVITGVTLDPAGKIQNVTFVEGKNPRVQKESFERLRIGAEILNQMIVVN